MRRWCAALTCAVGVFLVAPASPVSAHASFISSNPVDGSVLVESPAVAELRFSEEILASASSVQLLQLGSGRTEALEVTTAQDGHTLLAELPALDTGRLRAALLRRGSDRSPQDGRVGLVRHRRRRPAVGFGRAGQWIMGLDRLAGDHRRRIAARRRCGGDRCCCWCVPAERDLERVTRLAVWSSCCDRGRAGSVCSSPTQQWSASNACNGRA